MKTVFIMGAGASVEAGAPLMRDFLTRARQLQAKNAFGASTTQIQDVLDAALKDLQPVFAKSKIAYDNIEELFSAIDIGQLIETFGSRPPESINSLRESIVVFIYRTIEETVRIPFVDRKLRSLPGYGKLAKLVREKVEETARLGANDVSFITFNYDTCLEFALTRARLGIEYALGQPFISGEEQGRFSIPVLKLHGSINWATCPACRVIVPTEIDPWRNATPLDMLDQLSELPLMLGSRIAGTTHQCGTPLDPVPFIVPPTWNKASAASGLRSVWQRAAKELGSAERVIVIGYSLPPTDVYFRHLFALACVSDTHLERFVVINGVDGDKSAEAFRSLLGPMTAGGFRSNALVFSGAENAIRNALLS